MWSNSVSNHTRDKQIGLPLCSHPILLITCLIIIYIGLHSVLLLLLIKDHISQQNMVGFNRKEDFWQVYIFPLNQRRQLYFILPCICIFTDYKRHSNASFATFSFWSNICPYNTVYFLGLNHFKLLWLHTTRSWEKKIAE